MLATRGAQHNAPSIEVPDFVAERDKLDMWIKPVAGQIWNLERLRRQAL